MRFDLSVYSRQLVQTVLMTLMVLALLISVTLPVLVLLSIFYLINPAVAQTVLTLILFAAIWFVVPMAFSPHGIYASQKSAPQAVINSIQLVRRYLPGTGLFLLVALLLTQGLNLLWAAPPASSWMLLLGIGGHAFIITALIASSFVYYRGGMYFMQQMQERQKQSLEERPLL